MNAILNPKPRMPLGYLELKGKIAAALMSVGAVLTVDSKHELVVTRGTERGFLLASHRENPDAPLSPFYLNLRTPDNPKPGPLTPEIVQMVASAWGYFKLTHQLDCNAVAGVPNAGDPFAQAFANTMRVPHIALDKIEQDGEVHVGSVRGAAETTQIARHPALADDVLSKADMKIKALRSLRKSGFVVTNLMVVVDREQGGVETLAKEHVTVDAIFTISELLDIYVDSGELKPYMRAKILQYLLENS